MTSEPVPTAHMMGIKPRNVVATELGLLPIMWSTGTGADVMKRIAAPLIGGIFTSFLLELLVYPAIYEIWKWHFELKGGPADDGVAPEA